MTKERTDSIQIRRARLRDAEFLAWVTLSASRSQFTLGLWDRIIGADDRGCLDYLARLAVAEPRSLYHYENFLVAEAKGQPAAALCGFQMRADTWTVLTEAMSAVQKDIGWSKADVAASQQRFAPIWACFPQDVGADWVIENVATKPEYRRQGLASALLGAMVREGVERGRQLAQITLYIGNDSARTAYEKLGFRFSDQTRCPALEPLFGAVGFVRLLRKLQA